MIARLLPFALLGCAGPAPVRFEAPDPDVIEVLRRNQHQWTRCTPRDGPPQGHVMLSWDVKDGRVPFARIVEDTTEVEGYAACLRDTLSQWSFDGIVDETYAQILLPGP